MLYTSTNLFTIYIYEYIYLYIIQTYVQKEGHEKKCVQNEGKSRTVED